MLTSIVIDHLQQALPNDAQVIGFFNSYTDLRRDKERVLFGTLLQQLATHHHFSWEALEELYKRHQNGTQPKTSDLLVIFKDEIRKISKIFVVVDALDEWSNNLDDVGGLVSHLKSLGTNVNVLITSRPIPQLEETLSEASTIDISLPIADLETYLGARMSKLQERGALRSDSGLHDMARRAILDSCEGL